MKELFVIFVALAFLCLHAYAGDSESPSADSKGQGKVETGDTNIADIKMSTEASGKGVKSTTSMQATSSPNKGSTKGEAKTEVKGSRR